MTKNYQNIKYFDKNKTTEAEYNNLSKIWKNKNNTMTSRPSLVEQPIIMLQIEIEMHAMRTII